MLSVDDLLDVRRRGAETMDGEHQRNAFPTGHYNSGGLTVREYYAAKAMPAVIAAWGLDYTEAAEEASIRRIAQTAFMLADAMLAAAKE